MGALVEFPVGVIRRVCSVLALVLPLLLPRSLPSVSLSDGLKRSTGFVEGLLQVKVRSNVSGPFSKTQAHLLA